jgi:hypothetical protein
MEGSNIYKIAGARPYYDTALAVKAGAMLLFLMECKEEQLQRKKYLLKMLVNLP